jgi:crooked neck
VYERAVANLPPATEKRYWQRYIYLWIKYALFEELDSEEPDRAREVYRACLKLVPHQVFTFSKVKGVEDVDRCTSRYGSRLLEH